MFRKIIQSLKGDRRFFTIVFFILFMFLVIGIVTPIIIDVKENNWNEELEEQGIEMSQAKQQLARLIQEQQ